VALAPVTGGQPGGLGNQLLHLLDAVAQTGAARGGPEGVLGNLAAGPELTVATGRFAFGNLYFFTNGKEEALVYRRGLFREDNGLRSANVFQDLLPRTDPPLPEVPVATGPHEVDAAAESQILEVNQVGDRAVGVLRGLEAAEDGSRPEGPTDGAVVDALGIVGEDPAFRILPDPGPPAPEVHLVPVEDRDQAVVPTLLAGAAPAGAEAGTTGTNGRDRDLDLAPARTAIVVGVDPMPDQSPAEGLGKQGPFTVRPQAIPDVMSGPWSSIGEGRGDGPRSAAEGGFVTDPGLTVPGDPAPSLLPPETEAAVPALERAVSAVSLLGLWFAVGNCDPAGKDPARPATNPHR
jgi:hypothetical protein